MPPSSVTSTIVLYLLNPTSYLPPTSVYSLIYCPLIHWEVAKRMIHTNYYSITYSQEGNWIEGYAHNLAGYTDTNFAGDVKIADPPLDEYSHSMAL